MPNTGKSQSGRLVQQRADKLKAFISYSRKDAEFAERLFAALEARGIDAIIDRRDLPLIEEWQKELLGFIRGADAVIFVITPNSVGSQWCSWEISQVAGLNKRIAPVVAADLPPDLKPPEAVSKLNYVFFTGDNDFEGQIDQLAKALNTDMGWVKEHTRLGEAARRWDERKRTSALLLRGQDIAAAEKWVITRPREAPRPTELHGEYIHASRRGATSRARLAIVGAMVVALVSGGLAIWAHYQRMQAREQREVAQQNFGVAKEAADSLVGDLAGGLKDEVGVRTETVSKILGFADTAFKKLVGRGEDPDLLASQADMLLKFGETYSAQGDTAKERQSVERALEIMKPVVARDPAKQRWQSILATAHHRRGVVLDKEGIIDQAGLDYDAARAIRERLSAAKPDDADLAHALAETQMNIGERQIKLGNNSLGLDLLKKSLAEVQRFAAIDRRIPKWQDWFATASYKVGQALYEQGKYGEAVPLLEAGIAASQRAANTVQRSVTQEIEYSGALVSLGNIRINQGRKKDALSHFERSMEISLRLTASDTNNAERTSDLANAHFFVGEALSAQGKNSGALEAFKKALQHQETVD